MNGSFNVGIIGNYEARAKGKLATVYLKQVVIGRKIRASESRFNQKFMDFAEYYGIVIRLCYPYRPETKGKIENTIKYVRNNFWAGRTFESPSDINVQCREWLKKVNSQVHGTTHEIPLHRMKDERLNPLSTVPPYMTRKEESRKISRDCYVSYKGNRYSVPWKYAGRKCRIIEESSVIGIEVDSVAIADHSISFPAQEGYQGRRSILMDC